jgi:hypothetical protein
MNPSVVAPTDKQLKVKRRAGRIKPVVRGLLQRLLRRPAPTSHRDQEEPYDEDDSGAT